MCKALLPGDDESMSDEAIWETLPVSFSLTHYKLRVPEPDVFLFRKKLNYCSNCYPFRIAVEKRFFKCIQKVIGFLNFTHVAFSLSICLVLMRVSEIFEEGRM